MHIIILGTRGIPNHYGGFEQCAEYLALGLVKRGHKVTVYNSHNHPYQGSEWNDVQLVHMNDPEHKWGTAGQFIYDLNCIRDLRKRSCDIILQLGYTSNSVWGWLLPGKTVVTTNMDGLEWKRTKYSATVRNFLVFAEKCAVRFSDHLISDSVGIKDYLKGKYGTDSTFIPYGADLFTNPQVHVLEEYFLHPFKYDLLIARLEPENSIEIILDGVVAAGSGRPFLVIGNHNTRYGEYLKSKYKGFRHIRFLGGIYNIVKLNNIRYYSNLYFHGHTVGGTNPSLLEAMASESLISANDNAFNKSILGDDALYFNSADDVTRQLLGVNKHEPSYRCFITRNTEKIRTLYRWDHIVDQYEAHFRSVQGIITR